MPAHDTPTAGPIPSPDYLFLPDPELYKSLHEQARAGVMVSPEAVNAIMEPISEEEARRRLNPGHPTYDTDPARRDMMRFFFGIDGGAA